MRRLFGFVLLAACYRPNGFAECELACTTACPDDLQCGSDGQCHEVGTPTCAERNPDGGLDSPDANFCFGTGIAPQCFGAIPTSTVLVQSDIDTDGDPRCRSRTQPMGPSLCVIEGGTIAITAPVRVHGSRALVLVAATELTVSATLDVSSKVAGVVGAAADFPGCIVRNGAMNGGFGGGAAGGTFNGLGGAGGRANDNGVPLMPADPAPAPPPIFIRAGCRGGAGGATGGVGGASGGAVYLIAGATIVIDGRVNASGASGVGGSADTGGGGGGTGGFVGLDAPTITVRGQVFALGGAGGTGGGTTMPGISGTDPMSVSVIGMGAIGVQGSGSGGAGSNPEGAGVGGDGTTGTGGGGGGGAGGFTRVFGTLGLQGGIINPLPD